MANQTDIFFRKIGGHDSLKVVTGNVFPIISATYTAHEICVLSGKEINESLWVSKGCIGTL